MLRHFPLSVRSRALSAKVGGLCLYGSYLPCLSRQMNLNTRKRNCETGTIDRAFEDRCNLSCAFQKRVEWSSVLTETHYTDYAPYGREHKEQSSTPTRSAPMEPGLIPLWAVPQNPISVLDSISSVHAVVPMKDKALPADSRQ